MGRKNRALAFVCSLIPGLNQVYLGRYGQAAVNITAHAALASLSWYSFRRGDIVSGILFASTELSWYVYGFTLGMDGVDEANALQERRFQASFSLDLDPASVGRR